MILTDMIFGNGRAWLRGNKKIMWLMIATYFTCTLAVFGLSNTAEVLDASLNALQTSPLLQLWTIRDSFSSLNPFLHSFNAFPFHRRLCHHGS